MAAPWEKDTAVAPEAEAPWELRMTTGVAPGRIPYTDPAQMVAQGEARQNEAQTQNFNEWFENMRRNMIRAQYGPGEAIDIAAANAVAQPVMGAIDLMMPGQPMKEFSDESQKNVNALLDARPAGHVGTALPYMVSGPLASTKYLHAVSKMAPGVTRNILSNPMTAAAIPGAAEAGAIGYLDPHQDALMAAYFGGVGGMAGTKVGQFLSDAPTNLSPYANRMLDYARKFKLSGHPNKSVYDYMMPGAKTGNLGFKEVDDAIMKNPQAVSAIRHRADVPQNELSRRVYEQAGLEGKVDIEPGDLWEARRNLGSQYDALERQSAPIASNKTYADLDTARQAFRDLSRQDETPWADQLEDEFLSIINSDDTIPVHAYQGMKNKLKTLISTIRDKSEGLDNVTTARLSLAEDYLQILRHTMKQGSSDPNILKQWDALDAKYAANRFLEDSKAIKQGQLDFSKLVSKFETDNPAMISNPSGPWKEMVEASLLGDYIQKSKISTLGAHHEMNQLMGTRQHALGPVGRLMHMGADSSLIPKSAVQYYSWRNPKPGMWFPQEAPNLFFGPATSAAERSLFLNREVEEQ